ncbi:MAG: thiamine phosphate synthase [Rhodospirillaceae bacterium]|nr:thiamine phosphate synthase [Rhodospirillaceae bacterium]
MSLPPCRLYLVTPPVIDVPAFADTLAAALDGGHVAALQLRLKGAPEDDICRAIDALRPMTQQRGVAFILNDAPQLASETGCDGVHIGQSDMAYDQARELVGAKATIGVTCHDSRHLAMIAAERGADYVAFGAFFPTATKVPDTHAGLEVLEMWRESMLIPCVAIGGITVENCRPLVQAGADFIAVVSGVWDHPDGPAKAVGAFNKILSEESGAGG